MKKFLLVVACAAIIAGNSADTCATLIKPRLPHAQPAARAAESGAKWFAKTQKAYGWTGSQWMLDEVYRNDYNAKGQIMVQTITDSDGSVNRQKNTWNANGMLSKRITECAQSASRPFQQKQQLVRTYDDRLISFITFNNQLILQNNEWVPSNNYKQTITRNDAGNVTLMERAVYFQGIYDPTFRLHVEYDPDGTATAITTEDLNYDYSTQQYFWKPGNSYKDIKWESTDGQIVSIENLFEGANRVKEANATISGIEYRLSVDYGDDGSWTAHLVTFDEEMDMDLEEKTEFTPLDEFGSCIIVTTMAYLNEGRPYNSEILTQEYRYDANGLILLEETTYNTGETVETVAKMIGEVIYDADNGYPLSWTLTESDPDTGEMVNAFRAEYSDYVNLGESGLNAIGADLSGSGFYNMLGQPLVCPTEGSIVIERNANGARKIKIQ